MLFFFNASIKALTTESWPQSSGRGIDFDLSNLHFTQRYSSPLPGFFSNLVQDRWNHLSHSSHWTIDGSASSGLVQSLQWPSLFSTNNFLLLELILVSIDTPFTLIEYFFSNQILFRKVASRSIFFNNWRIYPNKQSSLVPNGLSLGFERLLSGQVRSCKAELFSLQTGLNKFRILSWYESRSLTGVFLVLTNKNSFSLWSHQCWRRNSGQATRRKGLQCPKFQPKTDL